MFEYDLGNLSDIETSELKYKDYKIIEFNSRMDDLGKELFILGHKTPNKPKKTIHKSPEILLDMLKLGQIIDSTWNSNGRLNNHKTQIAHSDEILKLCNKYGILYIDGYFINNYPGTFIIGFSIRELKQIVHDLYITYKRWDILNNYTLVEIKRKDFLKYAHIETQKDVEYQKSQLALFSINNVPLIDNPRIDLKYNQSKNSYEVLISANSPISVAYLQLKFLIANRMEEKNIITCKKCGDIVISEHGNMKYCDKCRMNQNRDDVKNHRIKLENKAKDYIYNKYSKLNISPNQILEIESQYIKDNIGKSTPFNKKKIEEWLNTY